MLSPWLLPLLALRCAAAAAPPDFSTTSNISSWNQSDWSLTATQLIPAQYQSRMSLANGYVGASVAAAGPFFESDVNYTDSSAAPPTNGWPLFDTRIAFSTISGFYNVQKNATGNNYPWLTQYGWDSFIAGIPHPTAIVFAFGSAFLDGSATNKTISNYTQKVTMSTGVTEWSYTWTPSNATTASFAVTFSVIFSRSRPNVIACKATINSTADINGTATDLLDGRSAVRSNLATKGQGFMSNGSAIYTSVYPDGLANVTAWEVSLDDFPSSGTPRVANGSYVNTNATTIGQTFDIQLKKGQPATFYKYVGVASTDKFPAARMVAQNAAASAKSTGWDGLVAEHSAAWRALMTTDSIDNFTDPATGTLPSDPNIQILQIASVASTFQLLQNLQPDGSGLNDNSIAVSGLASDSYAGQIFWDADTWMAPSLNLAFPNYAKQIANFRVKQHPQALSNAAFNGFPNGSALYSWTAGRYGNCTATGPCRDYEYHLNYDIAYNILQLYNVTKNDTWFNNGPLQVVLSVANMTAGLLQYNKTDGKYWLHNATDPDEYANNVDNPSFTISSASQLLVRVNDLLLSRGQPANDTWTTIADNVALPRAASNITLEYQTMNNSVQVKQADVVLMTYPLGYTMNYTGNNSLTDLDYYSIKQSPNGPALTFSAFAIDANTVSPSGCAAYTYTLKAFLPYLREPWYQFSEQQIDDPSKNGGTNPAFPFLTGHGGALQISPFGFLGVRTDRPVLFLSPSLPPQIPNLKVRTFYYAGVAFNAVMNSTHTKLTRVPPPMMLNQTTFSGKSMPFTVGSPDGSSQANYTIGVNQTVTIPNRLYWQNTTYPKNIIQCLPVTSQDQYVAGQVPEAANDGALATSWQPMSVQTARLLVNTSSLTSRKVSGVYFDFGARPPMNATVWFYNATASGNGTGPQLSINAKANAPPQTGLAVVPVQTNTTNLILNSTLNVFTGQWAQLAITGCAGCDMSMGTTGATIAEFVVY